MKLYDKLRESFKSGLVMILPVLITILIINFLSSYVFLFINPLVKGTNLTKYTGNIEIIAQIIAITVVVVFITLMGYISNYKASERLSKKIQSYLKEIPVFGDIYSAVESISSSFSEGNDKFDEVVLVEFPWEDKYSVGLIASDAPDKVNEAAGNENMKSIYVPLSPNPTIGHFMMAEENDYTKLDMTVQEGMKLVMTSGVANEQDEIPEDLKKE